MIAALPRTAENTEIHHTAQLNRGQAYSAYRELLNVVDSLNRIRVELSITDDAIANYLGVCMNTYRKHKKAGYKTLSALQIEQILHLFMQSERVKFEPNKRVLAHSKNRVNRCDDDDDDDHGD
ncbi:MAG: hypothetical protein ACRDBG_09850 [Waterburya sp.]